ncbi:MAG: DnaJ domain-containing protein [Pseudomonadota bacterium]|jgi:DnaJ-domain-containing protein 1
MPTLIAGIVAVVVIYLGLQMFRAADPKRLAKALRFLGGALCLATAAFTGLRGHFEVAIPLGLFGAGLLGWSPLAASGFANFGGRKSGGQTSQVRSQFLDMVLDHDTGALNGRIVAGPHAGRDLDEFDLPQLAAMMTGFDAESCALLESYLDRRFPRWRENAESAGAGRNRSQPAGGKMTADEAYEILGLKPGASREEIGRAHRGLMKKLHPDQGGSTYLAARVNEAKDTLLRTHRN